MNKCAITLLKIVAFFSVLSGICFTTVHAAEYYVSPDGTADWNSSINIATPCSPQTAMANAVAGDIVYFRGGTYALRQPSDNSFYWINGILNPSHSGTATQPIVFMAYPGELPVMDVKSVSNRASGIAFGLNNNEYITYDGFKLIADGGLKAGGIKIQGNDAPNYLRGNIVRNCEFNGGTTVIASTDNWEGLRIERTTGTLVENCLFYSYRQTREWHNTSALKMYNNDNLTVRNCEVYNCSTGIYLKRANSDSAVYNNFIHDSDHAGLLATYLTNHSDNVSIYNNVIINMSSQGFTTESEEQAHANNLMIYNNTVYNTGMVGLSSGKCNLGKGVELYNNIFPSGSTSYTFVPGYTSDPVRGYIKAADHNQWTSRFIIGARANGSQRYTSLASWKSSGELDGGGNPGTGSLASDPLFINGSGSMTQLEDFKLALNSPCRGAGRAGVDMGANIDLVGIKRGDLVPPPPDRPAAVKEFIHVP